MVYSQEGNQIFKPVLCITGGVGPMTVSLLMENTVLAAVRFFRIFFLANLCLIGKVQFVCFLFREVTLNSLVYLCSAWTWTEQGYLENPQRAAFVPLHEPVAVLDTSVPCTQMPV